MIARRVRSTAFGILTIAACVVLARPDVAFAQDEVRRQIWLDYNPRVIWLSGFEAYGDIGVRTELNSRGWTRLVVRPGVRGPVGRFRLAGGLGTFYTANDSAANQLEFRPFQGINWTWPSGRIPLDHYVRLEERFDFETADWNLDFSSRVRYRLQTEFRWSAVQSGAHWRLVGHAEGFLTFIGEADEKFRFGVGIERAFVSNARVRLDLTWQIVGAPFSGAPTDEFYVRVRFFQRWAR